MRFIDIVTIASQVHVDMKTTNNCLAPIAILGNSFSLESEIKNFYNNNNVVLDIYHTTPADDKTYGLYTRYENNTRILFDIDISSALNSCWTRFVGAKELSHALLDKTSESKSTDILPLVEMLLNQPPEINLDNHIHSEYVAFCFAVEILVPYKVNHLVLNTSKTSYEIADLLKVPEKIVDLVRSEWYQELRVKSYKDM